VAEAYDRGERGYVEHCLAQPNVTEARRSRAIAPGQGGSLLPGQAQRKEGAAPVAGPPDGEGRAHA
jgi:hypothetical protein